MVYYNTRFRHYFRTTTLKITLLTIASFVFITCSHKSTQTTLDSSQLWILFAKIHESKIDLDSISIELNNIFVEKHNLSTIEGAIYFHLKGVNATYTRKFSEAHEYFTMCSIIAKKKTEMPAILLERNELHKSIALFNSLNFNRSIKILQNLNKIDSLSLKLNEIVLLHQYHALNYTNLNQFTKSDSILSALETASFGNLGKATTERIKGINSLRQNRLKSGIEHLVKSTNIYQNIKINQYYHIRNSIYAHISLSNCLKSVKMFDMAYNNIKECMKTHTNNIISYKSFLKDQNNYEIILEECKILSSWAREKNSLKLLNRAISILDSLVTYTNNISKSNFQDQVHDLTYFNGAYTYRIFNEFLKHTMSGSTNDDSIFYLISDYKSRLLKYQSRFHFSNSTSSCQTLIGDYKQMIRIDNKLASSTNQTLGDLFKKHLNRVNKESTLRLINESCISSITKEEDKKNRFKVPKSYAYLNYFLGEKIYTDDDMLLSVKTNDTTFTVNLGHRSECEALINKLRAAKSSHSSKFEYVATSRRLFEILVKPVFEELDKSRYFLVSTDGPLHHLSFDELIVKGPNSNFKDQLFLMQEKIIIRQHYPQEYNSSNPKAEMLNKISIFSFTDKNTINNHQTSYSELPFAYKEAQELNSLFQKARIFAGLECTKQMFIRKLSESSPLHITTHGYSHQDLFNHGLIFRTQNKLDTFFMFDIISNTEVPEFIFLNTCHSANGFNSNEEGLISTTYYLQKLGLHHIISNLWAADDLATYQIAKFFYNKLSQEKSIEISLNHARQKYLETCSEDKSHPRYWANIQHFSTKVN